MKIKSSIVTDGGFTVIEVLVAVAIIAVGILALAAGTISITQGNRVSTNYTIAVNLAQEKMEEIKAQSSFTNGTTTDSPTSSSTGVTFTRTGVISSTTETNLKQIDVTVSWTEYGLSRSVTLSTYVYVG